MVERNFATSGQGRPSESTAMWLSGPAALTGNYSVLHCSPPRNEKRRRMASRGWGVARARATERRSHGYFRVAF
jgi:hypothetical protein